MRKVLPLRTLRLLMGIQPETLLDDNFLNFA